MDDLVQRLRNTPNWMRESFGSWKDCVLKYDRAPFEAADEIERLTAERDALSRKLRLAEIKLRDRAHPASEPRDPPECLATLGFWPECGCGECYAIHCLSEALGERDALQAKLDALISGKNTT